MYRRKQRIQSKSITGVNFYKKDIMSNEMSQRLA